MKPRGSPVRGQPQPITALWVRPPTITLKTAKAKCHQTPQRASAAKHGNRSPPKRTCENSGNNPETNNYASSERGRDAVFTKHLRRREFLEIKV